MTTEVALYDAVKKYLHDGTIDLDTDTIKLALLSSAYVPVPAAPTSWTGGTVYPLGTILRLSGIYYEAVVSGVSGISVPAFPTVRGGTVTDNTITWFCWGYCPPSPHTVFANVAANELPTDLGYTAGGVTLSNKAVTYSGRTGKFSADPALWLNASFTTARYAAMYRSGTVNALTDPLMCYLLLDNTPADINLLTPTTFTIQWPAAGIFTF